MSASSDKLPLWPTASIETVDPADEPHVLARHLARFVETELSGCKPETRRDVVQALLDHLDVADQRLSDDSRQLLSLVPTPAPGTRPRSTTRPATPLSDAALLTNAHREPNIGSEVRAELASAHGVDVVTAFVEWHGLRLLERKLTELRERVIPLQVINTTYICTTEREALDRLVRDFGAHVKVHCDTQRTRLHAKPGCFAPRPASTRHTSGRPTSPARRGGVECTTLLGGDVGAAEQVPSDLRLLLARHGIRNLRSGPARRPPG